MQNFKKVSDSNSNDGSLFCPYIDTCYNYTNNTEPLGFLSIGPTNFLISVANVSDAWVT